MINPECIVMPHPEAVPHLKAVLHPKAVPHPKAVSCRVRMLLVQISTPLTTRKLSVEMGAVWEGLGTSGTVSQALKDTGACGRMCC